MFRRLSGWLTLIVLLMVAPRLTDTDLATGDNVGPWLVGLRRAAVQGSAPPRPPAPVLAVLPRATSPGLPPRPAPTRWVPLPMEWETGPGALPTIADRVHDDIGFDVSRSDFLNPGPIDSPLTWLTGGGWRAGSWLNGALISTSTPVGTAVDLKLFFSWDAWKVAFEVWNQDDGSRSYPGLNLEFFEFPLSPAPRSILFTPRLSLWSQPDLRSPQGWSMGSLGSMALEVPVSDTLWVWVESRAKTQGWAAGAGDAATMSVRAGLHWML